MARQLAVVCLLVFFQLDVLAQVGEHRNDFAIGISAGYAMSRTEFVPKVPQDMHGGPVAGVTFRYTSEKYINSICAIVGEVNLAKTGWQERIWDRNDQPVVNQETGLEEAYSRHLTYVQVPVFARLGWGRERNGMQFFFQIGPQMGFLIGEEADVNFDIDNPNVGNRVSHVSGPNIGTAQFSNMYHMDVENKFDYGIAAGFGLEWSNRHVGHFMLEGRYYYGLGNLYGNTKRDYFARSNMTNIVVKLSYLFDLTRTKNSNIK